MHKDKPQVVIFAILANPEGMTTGEIVHLILERLKLLEGNKGAIRKFINQLLMLSEKHNLQAETVHQIEKEMKYKEEFEYDYYFLIGEKRGKEEGREEGLSVGKEKGQAIKDIIAIRNMLAKNFDLTTIAEILEVPNEQVLDIKNQLAKEPQIVASLRMQTNVDFDMIGADLSVSPLLVEVLKKEYGL